MPHLRSVQPRLHVEDLQRAAGDRSTCTLWIETDDARALHEGLAGRVTVEWGPEVYAYGRREFAIRDPDGSLVILSEATDDPVTSPDD
jgi:uncharacterized glyoxalase superfamily protein PhnB